jgi:hypothetical protein
MRRKKFYFHPILWCLMGLLTLTSFILFKLLNTNEMILLRNVSSVSHDDNDIDWLRNSNNLSLFVRHDNKTAIISPRFNDTMVEQKRRREIACFVISSPNNQIARSVIRRTWGKILKPLFLLGIPKNQDKQTMIYIKNEALIFNDMIVEDFIDSYQNLTIKTAFALKNFVTHFSDSKFFFKIDDDVALNVENLYKYLNSDEVTESEIIGMKGRSVFPHREPNSKWYIPTWMYNEDKFPEYLDGPSYLIPSKKFNKEERSVRISHLTSSHTKILPKHHFSYSKQLR